MRAEALEKLVNRPVKDIYGRYVGFVVGFSVETSGELKSVGVDQGNGEFTEYASQRIVSAEEGFVVIPTWKVDCESFGKENDAVKRRAKALQDLAHEGEVPRAIFEEMIGKYNDEAAKIGEAYGSLAGSMAVRISELEEQRERLERFLVNVKVQHRAGEIDEGAYKVASDCCQAMQKRNAQEKDELSKMLKLATDPVGSSTTSTQASTEQPPVQTIAQTA